MAIRSTAKAIWLENGKILLNRCQNRTGNVYFALPGGGQRPFETLEETVVREVREETGFSVRPVRLLAVCEEIFGDAAIRRDFPEYAHRLHHIFLVERTDEARMSPQEKDFQQMGCEWLPWEKIGEISLCPRKIKACLGAILCGQNVLYLGCDFIEEGL